MLLNGPWCFFLPRAMTKVARRILSLDLASEFATLGGQRLGISMDSVEKQAEFTTRTTWTIALAT